MKGERKSAKLKDSNRKKVQNEKVQHEQDIKSERNSET